MIKNIYFVRHGHYKTRPNDQCPECHLSLSGIEQINRLAKKLTKQIIEVIISSPYVRTLESAYILGKVLKKEVLIEKALEEIHFRRTVSHAKAIYFDIKSVVEAYSPKYDNFVIVSHEYPISLYLSKESGVSYFKVTNDMGYLRLLAMGECIHATFHESKFFDMETF